ncbi:MAG: LysM peptidoglycan-binding domain-containing protein, partial [Planctomycetota bacterium]
MFHKYAAFVILVLPALFAGCFRAAPSSDFPEARRLPGGFNALEAVGGSAGFHIVGPGETLYAIAKRHGVSVEALKNVNAITDERLVRAGARLRIPKAGAAPSTPLPAPKPKPARATPLAFERRYIRPCRGRTAVRFGDAVRGASSGHIEILAAEGTAVVAAKSGTVILASENFPGMGRVV